MDGDSSGRKVRDAILAGPESHRVLPFVCCDRGIQCKSNANDSADTSTDALSTGREMNYAFKIGNVFPFEGERTNKPTR